MRERDSVAESLKERVAATRGVERERDEKESLRRWHTLDPLFDSELDELLAWACHRIGGHREPAGVRQEFVGLRRHEHLMVRLLVSGRARRLSVQSGRDGWLRQREGEIGGVVGSDGDSDGGG